MNEKQIFEEMKNLEKVIDPAKCNLISSYINGFLMDYEETLHVKNLELSNLWLSMRETYKSDSKTDRALEVRPEYQEVERIKLRMSQLKRMRSDLKERFQVLTMTKRY